MGCLGSLGVNVIDEDTAKLLSTLDLKIEEYDKTFNKNSKEANELKEKQLKNRHEKLSGLKEKNE